MSTESALTVVQLQRAIDRCLAAHPTVSEDAYALHPDASRLADVWAMLLIERQDCIERAALKPAVIDAYTRWGVSDVRAD